MIHSYGRLTHLIPLVVPGLIVALFTPQSPLNAEARKQAAQSASIRGHDQATQTRLLETYGRLPLSFEANQGQLDPRVRFQSRGRGYSLFLEGGEATLRLSKTAAAQPRQSGKPDPMLRSASRPDPSQKVSTALRLKLVGANPAVKVTGLDELPGKTNYFLGKDPGKWRTSVPTYAKVRCENVYPGISLVYYGNQGRLEYDFQLAPGANPQEIHIGLRGASGLNLDEQGNLKIQIGHESIEMRKPVAYQQSGSQRKEVSAQYVLTGRDRLGFELGDYDHMLPLIIDPVLVYSTYLGGSGGEFSLGIAVDNSGNAYVTGQTNSSDFPTTTNPIQQLPGGSGDAFVLKLNPEGTGLVYATYIGGSGLDRARKVVVDGFGNAYVAGHTASPNFPTTAGARQTTFGGRQDGFIIKLDAAGSALVYSTYLGGSQLDQCLDLAIDSQGNAYVAGSTGSADFPITSTIQTSPRALPDAFVTKLTPTGSGLIYSTYLGGSGFELPEGIAVDDVGNAYVTGRTSSTDFPMINAFQSSFAGGSAGGLGFDFAEMDAFATKINASGTAFVYSTFLGGSGDDAGWQIATDSSGNAYVAGATSSSNFPIWNAFQGTFGGGTGDFGSGPLDAFVSKFDTGGSLLYSTYLGGSGDENPLSAGLAVDAAGYVYVTGETSSGDFPLMNPWQSTPGGWGDGFVTKLSPDGSALVYSSYLGGSAEDGVGRVAVDAYGNAFLTGATSSMDFPTVNPLQAFGGASDLFVAMISPYVTPPPPQPLDPVSGEPARLTYNFGSYKYAVDYIGQPEYSGLSLRVTSIDTTPAEYQERVAGTPYEGTTCAVFTGPSGYCETFRVTCEDSSGATVECPDNPNPYTVTINWNTQTTVTNPGFLKAPLGTNTWENILVFFSQKRLDPDPTGVGRTKGSFSDFVFIEGVSGTPTASVAITIPVNNATYALNQDVYARYACAGTFLECVGTVNNGSRIDTSSSGAKSFGVDAVVSAGPTATKSVTYYVAKYGIGILPSPSVKGGLPQPVILELRDDNGNNVSSRGIALKAQGIVSDDPNKRLVSQPPGFAKASKGFVFLPQPSSNGMYAYTIDTIGLKTGSYLLQFSVSTDEGSIYSVPFQVK